MRVLVFWIGLISFGITAEENVMLRILNLLPIGSPKVEIGWGESLLASNLKPGYGNDYVTVPLQSGGLWMREVGTTSRIPMSAPPLFRNQKSYSVVVQSDSGKWSLQGFEDEWKRKRPRLRIWLGAGAPGLSLEAGAWGKWEEISTPWKINLSPESPPPETVRVRYRGREGEWVEQDYSIGWEEGKSRTLVITERAPGRLRVKVIGDGAISETKAKEES